MGRVLDVCSSVGAADSAAHLAHEPPQVPGNEKVPFLWISILALIVGLAPFSSIASWLILPYLLWVAFAAFLNLTIVRMNPLVGSQSMRGARPHDTR